MVKSDKLQINLHYKYEAAKLGTAATGKFLLGKRETDRQKEREREPLCNVPKLNRISWLPKSWNAKPLAQLVLNKTSITWKYYANAKKKNLVHLNERRPNNKIKNHFINLPNSPKNYTNLLIAWKFIWIVIGTSHKY